MLENIHATKNIDFHNYVINIHSFRHKPACDIQAFIPTWKLCTLRALWVLVAFVPNRNLDPSLERPMCCLAGPNKSKMGHLKYLWQTSLKIVSNPKKERPKQRGDHSPKKPMPSLNFIQSSCLVEICLQIGFAM
jgi:hypothetical protein